MVEIRTPRLAPAARPAEQVSTATATELGRLGGAMQNVADRYTAYYEEKAADNADLIWAQTQADWSRKFNETSPKAGEGYALSTLQDYDSYVDQVLPTVPMRQQENMQHMFAKYRINLESKALEAEAAARARARAEQKAETQRLRGLAMLEDPTFANYQMLSDGLEDKDRHALLGVYSDAVLRSRDGFLVDSLKGLVDDTDTFDQLLNADQKGRLLTKLGEMQLALAKEDEVAVRKMIEDAEAMVSLRGEADTDTISEMIELGDFPFEVEQDLKNQLSDRLTFAQDVYDIRRQSFGDSQTHLDNLITNATTKQDTQRIGIYASALDAHRKNIVADPAGYVIASDENLSLLQDKIQSEDKTGLDYDAYISALNQKYDTIDLPEQLRRYLPKGEAAAIAQQWNNQPHGVTGATLRQQIAEWGANQDAIFQEIITGGLSPVVQAQVWRHDDNVINSILSDLKFVENMGEKEVLYEAVKGEKVAALKAEILTETSEYVRAFVAGNDMEASNFVTKMVSVATDAYVLHVADAGDNAMAQEDFLNRMFREEVVNSKYAHMLIPTSVSGTMVEKATANVIKEFAPYYVDQLPPEIVSMIVADAGEDPTVADKAVAVEMLLSNGVFTLDPRGDGVVLGYNHGHRILDLGLDGIPFTGLAAYDPRNVPGYDPRDEQLEQIFSNPWSGLD